MIAKEPKGENGFGYDPILFLPEYGKTSAQLTPEEKKAISHRGEALRKMVEIIRSELLKSDKIPGEKLLIKRETVHMKIYITEVENADFNEFLNLALHLVSLDRLSKINELKNEVDKVASASAELLLSFAAEEYLFEKTSFDNLISGKTSEGVTFRPVSWRKLTGGYLGTPVYGC